MLDAALLPFPDEHDWYCPRRMLQYSESRVQLSREYSWSNCEARTTERDRERAAVEQIVSDSSGRAVAEKSSPIQCLQSERECDSSPARSSEAH